MWKSTDGTIHTVHSYVQIDLGDTVDSVPIEPISQLMSLKTFWFPTAYKSYVYTILLVYEVCNSLMSKKQCTYLN